MLVAELRLLQTDASSSIELLDVDEPDMRDAELRF